MPTSLISTLLAAGSSTTTHTPTRSSSGSAFFLVLLVALFLLYFFVLRPRSRRMREQAGGRSNLQVGDDVVTAGGILGRVVDIIGDEVVVEVAPGNRITFWRRAVNLRSAVAGAPPPRAEVPEDEPGAGYGVEDRYDDGLDGGATGAPAEPIGEPAAPGATPIEPVSDVPQGADAPHGADVPHEVPGEEHPLPGERPSEGQLP